VSAIEQRFGSRPDPRDVEILREPSGAPFARVSSDPSGQCPWPVGTRVPVSLSNSHSHAHALCALTWIAEAREDAVAVGVDLERVEPRSEGFMRDFLTAPERAFCAAGGVADRDRRANLVWSAKEAVLKVLERGLTADTWWLTCLPRAASPGDEAVSLVPPGVDWQRFDVETDPRLGAGAWRFVGVWCDLPGFVATLAIGTAAGRAQHQV
jgi:phosphopantetheinyl transferase (holo-ACP synthase)